MLNYKILKNKSVEIIKNRIERRVDFKEYFAYAADIWNVYKDRKIKFDDKSIALEFTLVECIDRGCEEIFALEINSFIAEKMQEDCKNSWMKWTDIAKEVNASIVKKYGIKEI